MEKYIIAIKDNFSLGFYERGHCFECKIEVDKVTINSVLIRWPETISIEQLEGDFIDMSKEDYKLYVELCENGEDPTHVLKKYLD